LKLEPLREDQYRQVAEWEFGPQPPDTDWPRYYAEMNDPKWLHMAIYNDGVFIGCLSLEMISADGVEYHVVTARHAIHPRDLAAMLLGTARDLFNGGFTLLTVRIPAANRAAAKLAIRCGMTETRNDSLNREFALRKETWGQASRSL